MRASRFAPCKTRVCALWHIIPVTFLITRKINDNPFFVVKSKFSSLLRSLNVFTLTLHVLHISQPNKPQKFVTMQRNKNAGRKRKISSVIKEKQNFVWVRLSLDPSEKYKKAPSACCSRCLCISWEKLNENFRFTYPQSKVEIFWWTSNKSSEYCRMDMEIRGVLSWESLSGNFVRSQEFL